MEYKIGSFNLHNIGQTALGMNNQRDLKTIARIIREEHFDIVALQEILSEGKAFIGEDYAKKSILMELGPGWDFCWADAEAENDRRHEGFAFVWNNKRLRKCTTEVRRGSGANNSTFQRTFEPRICRVNHKYMERKPFYGRFTANGMPGGTNVEFRLLCVHSFYGQKDDKADREKRLRELNILLQDIYPQINDRRYGDTYDDSYTIMEKWFLLYLVVIVIRIPQDLSVLSRLFCFPEEKPLIFHSRIPQSCLTYRKKTMSQMLISLIFNYHSFRFFSSIKKRGPGYR